MRQDRQVAIVHYNTPELTEAAILSLRKHGGKEYNITVFDNNVYQIIPETFHPDKMENTLQFHMQLVVNDKQ